MSEAAVDNGGTSKELVARTDSNAEAGADAYGISKEFTERADPSDTAGSPTTPGTSVKGLSTHLDDFPSPTSPPPPPKPSPVTSEDAASEYSEANPAASPPLSSTTTNVDGSHTHAPEREAPSPSPDDIESSLRSSGAPGTETSLRLLSAALLGVPTGNSAIDDEYLGDNRDNHAGRLSLIVDAAFSDAQLCLYFFLLTRKLLVDVADVIAILKQLEPSGRSTESRRSTARIRVSVLLNRSQFLSRVLTVTAAVLSVRPERVRNTCSADLASCADGVVAFFTALQELVRATRFADENHEDGADSGGVHLLQIPDELRRAGIALVYACASDGDAWELRRALANTNAASAPPPPSSESPPGATTIASFLRSSASEPLTRDVLISIEAMGQRETYATLPQRATNGYLGPLAVVCCALLTAVWLPEVVSPGSATLPSDNNNSSVMSALAAGASSALFRATLSCMATVLVAALAVYRYVVLAVRPVVVRAAAVHMFLCIDPIIQSALRATTGAAQGDVTGEGGSGSAAALSSESISGADDAETTASSALEPSSSSADDERDDDGVDDGDGSKAADAATPAHDDVTTSSAAAATVTRTRGDSSFDVGTHDVGGGNIGDGAASAAPARGLLGSPVDEPDAADAEYGNDDDDYVDDADDDGGGGGGHGTPWTGLSALGDIDDVAQVSELMFEEGQVLAETEDGHLVLLSREEAIAALGQEEADELAKQTAAVLASVDAFQELKMTLQTVPEGGTAVDLADLAATTAPTATATAAATADTDGDLADADIPVDADHDGAGPEDIIGDDEALLDAAAPPPGASDGAYGSDTEQGAEVEMNNDGAYADRELDDAQAAETETTHTLDDDVADAALQSYDREPDDEDEVVDDEHGYATAETAALLQTDEDEVVDDLVIHDDAQGSATARRSARADLYTDALGAALALDLTSGSYSARALSASALSTPSSSRSHVPPLNFNLRDREASLSVSSSGSGMLGVGHSAAGFGGQFQGQLARFGAASVPSSSLGARAAFATQDDEAVSAAAAEDAAEAAAVPAEVAPARGRAALSRPQGGGTLLRSASVGAAPFGHYFHSDVGGGGGAAVGDVSATSPPPIVAYDSADISAHAWGASESHAFDNGDGAAAATDSQENEVGDLAAATGVTRDHAVSLLGALSTASTFIAAINAVATETMETAVTAMTPSTPSLQPNQQQLLLPLEGSLEDAALHLHKSDEGSTTGGIHGDAEQHGPSQHDLALLAAEATDLAISGSLGLVSQLPPDLLQQLFALYQLLSDSGRTAKAQTVADKLVFMADLVSRAAQREDEEAAAALAAAASGSFVHPASVEHYSQSLRPNTPPTDADLDYSVVDGDVALGESALHSVEPDGASPLHAIRYPAVGALGDASSDAQDAAASHQRGDGMGAPDSTALQHASGAVGFSGADVSDARLEPRKRSGSISSGTARRAATLSCSTGVPLAVVPGTDSPVTV